jgi:hypothetical protein
MQLIDPIRMEALDPAVSHEAREVEAFGNVAGAVAVRCC